MSRIGIHLIVEGSEVVWVWRRRGGPRWYGVDVAAMFDSLKDVRQFWRDYEIAAGDPAMRVFDEAKIVDDRIWDAFGGDFDGGV